jgi:hypothetical protein
LRAQRADAALRVSARLRFVVKGLEDGQDLQHPEQALTARRHVEQPDVASLLSNALQLSHEHSHAGAVDVGHAGKIHDDLDASLVHKVTDLSPEHEIAIVEEDLSRQDQHGHVVHLPFHEAER